MINLRKIQYFLKVVDFGSLSRAALELGVTQPTLSQQIAALEGHLGRTLLVRGSQGVMVTEVGRLFYRHAQQLERQLLLAEEEVRTATTREGKVSLGLATCGAPSTLALPILRKVLLDHPGLQLRIQDNFAGSLSEAIMNGRLDLALVYGAGPSRGVRFQKLFLEELFLFEAPGTATGGRGPVSLEEHRDIPMVLPSGVHFLRPVIEKACAKLGFRPRVVAEIDSLTELKAALRAGVGAAILPRTAIDQSPDAKDLVARPIRPGKMETTVSLCTSANLPITSGIETLRSIILGIVEDRLSDRGWKGTRRLGG